MRYLWLSLFLFLPFAQAESLLSGISAGKEAPSACHAIHGLTESAGVRPSPGAMSQALAAYHAADRAGHLQNKSVLTVVDFSLPSDQKRLWVIDMKTRAPLLHIHSAQGKNSGLTYATHFSNVVGSDESSLGSFITGPVYYGKHGKSMRLMGISKGLNDHAYQRAIVVHAAPYMSDQYIQSHHRAGRSWGCFAVSHANLNQLIDYTKGGSLLFAYAPGLDLNSESAAA